MLRITAWWNNISIAKRLYTIVGIMALLIIAELLILTFAMNTLSAVRTFIGAESIWSKAQKRATSELIRYSNSKNENDFRNFLGAFNIPEADRRARVELEKTNSNNEVIREAFKEAGVHPHDIDPVIQLFKRFHQVSYLAKAIDTWKIADSTLENLKNTGTKYHHLVSIGSKNKKKLDQFIISAQAQNDQLTILEKNFSDYLSEGSRFMEKTINRLLFLAVLMVEGFGLTVTLLTTRYLSRGLQEINGVANSYGRGDFTPAIEVTSKDEIGILGESVNRMGYLLSKSHQDLENKIAQRTMELNQTIEENKKLYQETKKSVKMRDQFISIASHELKTPLTTLQFQLQLLNRALKDPTYGDPQSFSNSSLVQVQRLDSLINELMDLTRIKSGQLELHPEWGNLSGIATEYALALNVAAAKKGATIELKIKNSVMGFFDANRVGQVITNLVSNAIKYGEGKPIEVSVEEKDGIAIIQVKDHGNGISYEKQNSIFQCYERASNDTAIPGLGLGLYISKEIINAHRGKISVESMIGEGSVFIVEIPLNKKVSNSQGESIMRSLNGRLSNELQLAE